MRRNPLHLIGAGALVLAACGGSAKTTAAHTSSTGAPTATAKAAGVAPTGAARTCSATAHPSGSHLVVTVTTDRESVIYADDAHASPSTATYTLTHAPWVATLSLNDPAGYPVTVHVFGNRQEASCSAKST
ncbi:MAG TPA: hypothetical protein VMW49_04710 [Candidatus Dormibacteraeota bacterium]|nr:hypothetical protein [Candidatus Dormibacteraeota bacterium]